MAQKYDGGTVATATESIDDSASVSVSVTVPACPKACPSNPSWERSKWIIVVNGTRYFGHLQSERGSTSKSEDIDDVIVEVPRETKKERNRRLLHQDHENQARLVKTRRSKRPGNSSRQEGNTAPLEEEW